MPVHTSPFREAGTNRTETVSDEKSQEKRR